MNKFYSFLLFFFAFSPLIWSQQHRPTGLILEDKLDSTIPSLKPDGGKYDMLLKSVSLKSYCPTPGDQKQTSSCVAWTVGYGALTMLRAMEDGQTDRTCLTIGAHSASFIYNQIKGSCYSGAKFSDAFKLLKDKGDCLSISFQNSTVCDTKPSLQAKQEAAQFKIEDYARLFGQEDKTDLKKEETRRMLAFHLPVMVGLQVTDSFWAIKNGQKKWNPDEHEKEMGFHAMLVVGYNDYDKELELMNSFGTSWGNQGFIKMSYDDYARLAVYGFVMSRKKQQFWKTSPITESAYRSEAVFSLREVMTSTSKQEFSFIEVVFNEKEQTYSTPKKIWRVGDKFQLLAPNDATQYIYVIAMDGQGKIHLLFEKKEQILSEIIMPQKNSSYTLTEKGANYLCILSGPHPITHLYHKINQVQAMTGTFSSRIQTVFKDILVPPTDIHYAPNHLYFYNFSKEKSFVPFFIKQSIN